MSGPTQSGESPGSKGSSSTYPSPAPGGFSVVALIKEDARLVRTFVNYYVAEGAEHITIYFDGPSTVPAAELPPIVELIEVGPEDKKAIPTGDPGHRSAFQRILHKREHARRISDWMLAVDADEFVFTGGRLADYFRALPSDLDAIRFPVVEAVWERGGAIEEAFSNNWMRVPFGRVQSPLVTPFVYGRDKDFFRRGLIGHCVGKHAVRTSVPTDTITCHLSTRDGKILGRWAGSGGLASAHVAHFDAISLSRWVEKFQHRISGRVSAKGISRGRSLQVAAASEAIQAGEAADLFERFYALTPAQMTALKRVGKLRSFDVNARVRSLYEATAEVG